MGPKKATKVKSMITIEASELESCDSTLKRKVRMIFLLSLSLSLKVRNYYLFPKSDGAFRQVHARCEVLISFVSMRITAFVSNIIILIIFDAFTIFFIFDEV